MYDQAYAKVQTQQKMLTGSSPGSRLLQRTCACGQHSIAGGECSACHNERSTLLRSQRAFGSSSSLATAQNNSSAQGNISSLNCVVDNASHFDHDFSQIPVYSSHPPMLQTKLTVNQPGDSYEQEAERVTRKVMQMEGQGSSEAPIESQEAQLGANDFLTRNEASGTSVHGTTGAPPIVNEVLSDGGGQPLDDSTRAFMEPRFGHDFSRVRIHADERAAESAWSVNALAYTVGQDVVFGAGQYVPGTNEGKKLLAHELMHVVQQSSADDNSGRVVMRQPKKVETQFSGCTGNQPQQIDAVVQRAKMALNWATAVIGSAYGKPSSLSAANKQLLLDHFHTTSHDDLRKIFGTYLSIGRAFDAGLEFQCETTCPKTTAEVVCGYAYNTMWFGGIGPIHICFDTAGCDFAATAAPKQVALVIHEAAHRHAGIDDKVYAWNSTYSTLSSGEAMDNADSYAWFAVLMH